MTLAHGAEVVAPMFSDVVGRADAEATYVTHAYSIIHVGATGRVNDMAERYNQALRQHLGLPPTPAPARTSSSWSPAAPGRLQLVVFPFVRPNQGGLLVGGRFP